MINNKLVGTVITAVLFLVCVSVAGLSKTAMDASKEARAGNLASAPVPRSEIINAPLVGEVTLTATAGSPAGSFTTLKSAFDAINAGIHQGVIAISVNADTTETASAALNASGSGAALYTSISSQPAGGAPRTISGSLAAPLIDLNGADNVTIDGLNTGGNSLTLRNTSIAATVGTSTLRFVLDATNNTIQNCTISGSETLLTSGVVFFSTGPTSGNDNNILNNNNIGPAGANTPFNGIFASGSTATAPQNNSGVQITNNNIFDFSNLGGADWGINIASGNTDWTIRGNNLFQTATRTETTTATEGGIMINNTSRNGFIVSNNSIGGSTANAGGTPWIVAGALANRFRGISLSVGTTTATSVQGNTIANYIFSSTSGASTVGGPWNGIYLSSGNANIGTSAGNTIGNGTGTGSIFISILTNQGSLSSGIFAEPATSTSSISNNTIGSVSFNTSTITQGFQGIATTADLAPRI